MTEWVEKWHQPANKPWNLDSFFHPFWVKKGSLDEFLQGIKIPFYVVLWVCHYLNTRRQKLRKYAELHREAESPTWVSSRDDWKVLSSICMLIFSLTCSTCLWPRRTASSTEFALMNVWGQASYFVFELTLTWFENLWRAHLVLVLLCYDWSYLWPREQTSQQFYSRHVYNQLPYKISQELPGSSPQGTEEVLDLPLLVLRPWEESPCEIN